MTATKAILCGIFLLLATASSMPPSDEFVGGSTRNFTGITDNQTLSNVLAPGFGKVTILAISESMLQNGTLRLTVAIKPTNTSTIEARPSASLPVVDHPAMTVVGNDSEVTNPTTTQTDASLSTTSRPLTASGTDLLRPSAILPLVDLPTTGVVASESATITPQPFSTPESKTVKRSTEDAATVEMGSTTTFTAAPANDSTGGTSVTGSPAVDSSMNNYTTTSNYSVLGIVALTESTTMAPVVSAAEHSDNTVSTSAAAATGPVGTTNTSAANATAVVAAVDTTSASSTVMVEETHPSTVKYHHGLNLRWRTTTTAPPTNRVRRDVTSTATPTSTTVVNTTPTTASSSTAAVGSQTTPSAISTTTKSHHHGILHFHRRTTTTATTTTAPPTTKRSRRDVSTSVPTTANMTAATSTTASPSAQNTTAASETTTHRHHHGILHLIHHHTTTTTTPPSTKRVRRQVAETESNSSLVHPTRPLFPRISPTSHSTTMQPTTLTPLQPVSENSSTHRPRLPTRRPTLHPHLRPRPTLSINTTTPDDRVPIFAAAPSSVDSTDSSGSRPASGAHIPSHLVTTSRPAATNLPGVSTTATSPSEEASNKPLSSSIAQEPTTPRSQ